MRDHLPVRALTQTDTKRGLRKLIAYRLNNLNSYNETNNYVFSHSSQNH